VCKDEDIEAGVVQGEELGADSVYVSRVGEVALLGKDAVVVAGGAKEVDKDGEGAAEEGEAK
jgi:hypothetical protein